MQPTESPESEGDEIVSWLNEEAPSTSTSPTDYTIADADHPLAAMFPCELRYMDLSVLELYHSLRVPWMVQIRDEWRAVSDILDHRPKGLDGCVVVMGPPGIGKQSSNRHILDQMPLPASRSLQGKTCYLYYLLVQRLIDARPTVFQDAKGDVFVIEDTVQYLDAMVVRPGHDILTLVDADGTFCVPSDYIVNSDNHFLETITICVPALLIPALWFSLVCTLSFSSTAFIDSHLCSGMTFSSWIRYMANTFFLGSLAVMQNYDMHVDLRYRGGLGVVSVVVLWFYGAYIVAHLDPIWKKHKEQINGMGIPSPPLRWGYSIIHFPFSIW